MTASIQKAYIQKKLLVTVSPGAGQTPLGILTECE